MKSRALRRLAASLVLVAPPFLLSGPILLSGPLLLSETGCSIFSGVGDLQGGDVADAAPGAQDSSSPPIVKDAASPPDTSVVVDSATPPDSSGEGTATCGTIKCSPGVACCVDFTSSDKTCADSTGCHGASVPLKCTAAADCAAATAGPVCCLPISGGAQCQSSCNTPGAQTLCDPNAAVPCTNGLTCKPEVIIGGFSTCR